jgi:serine/threonine-protein kinase RIO1
MLAANSVKLERFVQDFTPEYLSEGVHGTIYRVSEDYVAKFVKSSTKLTNLLKEFKIAKELYALGVSVPKPIGFFEVYKPKSVHSPEGYYPAFVMEFIPDARYLDLTDLSINEYSRAKDLWKIELQKVKDLKFKPEDCSDQNNALYVLPRDKVYLIDFFDWRFI